MLDELKFNGTVLIPEPRVWATKAEFSYVGKPEFNYDGQINWEWAGIETASVVVFWVPRSEALPGFTTNVEFGLLVTSGKAVLGYPPNTDKMKYLHKLAERYHVPVLHTLRDTLATAILKAWTPNV